MAEISDGVAPPSERNEVLAAKQLRRRLVLVFGLIFLVAQVGIAVAVITGGHSFSWLPVLFTEVTVLGAIGLVFGLFRSRRLKLFRPSPLFGVDRDTRREVGRAVGRGEAVKDPALAGLAVEAASHTRSLRWLSWGLVVAGLAQLPNVLTRNDAVGRALALLLMATFLGNAASLRWLTGRAARAEKANTALTVAVDESRDSLPPTTREISPNSAELPLKSINDSDFP